jgi:dipeptidyl aminopeptidase/acylaminoacyl peptidase
MRNLLLVALLCFLPKAWLGATEPDVEAYAALPLIERPTLSPDGNRFACLMSRSGERLFVIMGLEAANRQPRVLSVGAGNELLEWHWVNDDWLLIRVATTVKFQDEDFRVSRVYGVSAEGNKLVPIARNRAAQEGGDILWVARDGSPRAMIAIQQSFYFEDEKFFHEVFEVDVSTGQMSSRVQPRNGVMDWYVDNSGLVRMGIGYSDTTRSHRLLYREKAGEPFRTIDRAKSREGESLTVPALFLAEPGRALAFSDHSGFNALYELDLNTMQIGKEIYSAPGYDVDSFQQDPTGTQLLGVHYTDTADRIQWLDPLMSKAQRDMEKAVPPGELVHIVSMSANQRRLVAHVGTPSTPGTYLLVDLDKNSMQPIAQIQPSLASTKGNPVRSVHYRARDGLQIEGVLTLPAAREPKKLPLIVLPHGGPAARDSEGWDWWTQYLAQLGYAIVQPNYRGSTGYGSAFFDKGMGQWGLAMQDDLLDAIDHLAREGIIDPKRVCIAGASYGGYAALRGAQRDGAYYRCAISYAGVADLNGMLRYDNQFLNSGRARDHWRSTAPDLRIVSPASWPEQFSIPVLLMHGKLDLRVPVKQSRVLAEKLTKAGKAVRYVEQPLGDHHFSRSEDRLQFLREMTDFLKAHNAP